MLSTSENADIFTARDIIYLEFADKKKIFFLFDSQRKNTKHNLTLFLVVSDFCSVFIGYTIGCKRSLHLENGLELKR